MSIVPLLAETIVQTFWHFIAFVNAMHLNLTAYVKHGKANQIHDTQYLNTSLKINKIKKDSRK